MLQTGRWNTHLIEEEMLWCTKDLVSGDASTKFLSDAYVHTQSQII